jgi:hypothetical protein
MLYEKAIELFEYIDGDLVWKISKYKSKIGKSVGTEHGNYKRVQVAKRGYLIHRLIFLMHYKYLPTIVDHIDGNTNNNKIENLRDATYYQNSINVKPRKDSKTQMQNVTWHKGNKKWCVYLTMHGKRKYFGYYKDAELADLVAKEVRNKFYGSFCRSYHA